MFLHYDMDSFFASIEMRDNPKLSNLPLVVGNHVVATSNYVARKYGIHSAQSVILAKKLCNNLVVVNSRTDYYFSIGKNIQKLISSKFAKAVFLSCDEGYIEFDENGIDLNKFAKEFKSMIYDKFKLPLSIGIGINRIIAKMACEVNKPNGIFILDTKEKFIDFVYDKKINIFPGIGTKTFDILYKRGIIYTRDVYLASKKELVKLLGKSSANHLLDMVRANILDDENIVTMEKSISKERTFYPYLSKKLLFNELSQLCDELKKEILIKRKYPLTVTVKIKNEYFETYTKSKTFNSPINENSDILKVSKDIFLKMKIRGDIRLIGVSISNFTKFNYEYLKLFGDWYGFL